ncbi:MAG: MarR family transcriptional regulator, partial [Nocardioides sp.]|nr:MarR family transcriptional regulator [Nocardioides sp.]
MDRADLGFLLARLLRRIQAGEEPILREAGLDMWGYVVMVGLDGSEAPTQAHLAERTGRDKTRLIRNLDRLEELGYVTRTPDPDDRRNRVVTLTTAGEKALRTCRKQIAAMEQELLAALDAEERVAFETALTKVVG